MRTTDTDRSNPFPGLRPFDSEEDYLFFGRETQTDDLLERLKENRFLAVVGASGSGKSSLVKAGLLPALHGGFMLDDASRWRVAMFRPGAHPIRAMAEALAEPDVLGHEDEELAAYQSIMLESTLRRGALGLIEVFEQARVAPRENLLVVVDQFEELFRFKENRNESQVDDTALAFVKLLLEASQSEQSIYIVITMRSDFLGDCSLFRDLPETINDGQFLVPRMRRNQRQQAIEGPVAVGGAKITKRLVQRLLNDVGDNPDQLPILQHALMRTWNIWEDEKIDDPIDLVHYEAIGGMAEALSQHGDEIYNALPDDQSRQIAETLFKRLTDRSQDTRGVRRPTSLEELRQVCKTSRKELIRVIDAFREPGRSLLMPPKGTEMRDDTTIDISHESLMRVWQRLDKWVDEEAESAKVYLRIAQTAQLHERKEAGLWRDPDLQHALEWLDKTEPSEHWAARYMEGLKAAEDFLDKSRQHWIDTRREETARQKRELQQAQELAEEQRQRAEEQTAAAKRLRWLVGLMTVFALLATAVAIFAYVQVQTIDTLNTEARERNSELEEQTNLARQNEQTALDNERRANINEQNALDNARQAEAYSAQLDSFVIELQKQVQLATDNADLARLNSELAETRRIEAERQKTVAEELSAVATVATNQATQQLLQNLGVELSIKALEEVEARNPEIGALLAREAYRFDQVSGSNYRNQIYDALRKSIAALSSDALVSRVVNHGPGIRAVAYSSRNWIAAGDDVGGIYVEDPDGNSYVLDGHTNWIRKVTFNETGTILGSSSRDGTMRLWQIVEGSAPSALTLPDGFDQVSPLALDQQLLTLQNDTEIINWRSQGTFDSIMSALNQRVLSVAYPSDTRALITRLDSGNLGVIEDLANINETRILPGIHTGNASDIVFNNANDRFATAGLDFDVRVSHWPISGNAFTSLKGHSGAVNSMAFSPDDSTLASVSSDGTLRLWALSDPGMGTIVLEGHDSWVRAVAFSPDGKSIVSGSANGEIRHWKIDAQYLVDQICSLTSSNLTEEQWKDFVENDNIAFETYYQPCEN